MRYCPFCRRINPGYPIICYYCAHTWYVRLCPRGHENPPVAMHCGTCGSADLSETAGTRPLCTVCVKIGIVLILFVGIIFLGRLFISSLHDVFSNLIPFIVCIVILIGIYKYALSVLPNPVRQILLKINGLILNMLSRIVARVGIKLKVVLKFLVQW